MKSLAPNTLIQNRYLIVQLIGKGGMGEVYLAVDQRLGSAVALKRMLFSDEEALGQAFEREAKTLARLRHPALTKVSDHFTENGMQYLVMEHISGDDLSNRLEQNQKPFPLSWVLFWADQLLDALNYLHSHEPPIIHRDIKPQNLKLTTDNHIILLDFGLAKDSVGETRLSSTGNVIAYTPHYASMEQIRGTGTTGRSDIYAISATMYQLLSNVVPDDALTRADSVLNGQIDTVKPLSEINPEVIPAISNIIAKGMSLSAEQRFANAKEMQMALREAYQNFQQGTSAATVAFNSAEQFAVPTPQSNIKTEQYPASNVSAPVGEKTEVMPVSLVKETSQSLAPEITDAPVDFNPTVPFGTPFTDNIEPSPSFGEATQVSPIDYSFPSGEKTEVIPFDLVPSVDKIENASPVAEKTEYYTGDIIAQNEPESFVSKDSFVSDEEGYSPEMTAHLVNYGDQVSELPSQETSSFVSTPQEEVKEIPVVVETKPEPKKKAAATAGGGGSKVFLIVGVLAVLAFLGIGAAGAGIYVFMPELIGLGKPTPTPAPTTEPTIAPTVTPTPEPTLEANTNTNSGNSTVDLTNTNSSSVNSTESNTNSDIAGDKTPRPTVEKTQTPVGQPTKSPVGQPTKSPITQPTKPLPQPSKTLPRPTAQPTVDHGKIQ